MTTKMKNVLFSAFLIKDYNSNYNYAQNQTATLTNKNVLKRKVLNIVLLCIFVKQCDTAQDKKFLKQNVVHVTKTKK